jgi:hypothetical protein
LLACKDFDEAEIFPPNFDFSSGATLF